MTSKTNPAIEFGNDDFNPNQFSYQTAQQDGILRVPLNPKRQRAGALQKLALELRRTLRGALWSAAVLCRFSGSEA